MTSLNSRNHDTSNWYFSFCFCKWSNKLLYAANTICTMTFLIFSTSCVQKWKNRSNFIMHRISFHFSSMINKFFKILRCFFVTSDLDSNVCWWIQLVISTCKRRALFIISNVLSHLMSTSSIKLRERLLIRDRWICMKKSCLWKNAFIAMTNCRIYELNCKLYVRENKSW